MWMTDTGNRDPEIEGTEDWEDICAEKEKNRKCHGERNKLQIKVTPQK